jgi:hypothetical protein
MKVNVASGTGALFIGDPVIADGTGNQSGYMGVTIAVGSEGTESVGIVGVITGFEAAGPDSLATHAGATGAVRTAIITPAFDDVVFRVNASNTTGPNPNDLGGGFDLVLGSGNTNTGKSGWALDIGDDNQAVATTGQVRLIGFDPRPDNVIGAIGTDTANIDCLVVFAESYWTTGAGGVD